MSGKRKSLKAIRAKSVGRSPAWLKTVAIAKPCRTPVRGTFGAASEVVRIDPETGLPLGLANQTGRASLITPPDDTL